MNTILKVCRYLEEQPPSVVITAESLLGCVSKKIIAHLKTEVCRFLLSKKGQMFSLSKRASVLFSKDHL